MRSAGAGADGRPSKAAIVRRIPIARRSEIFCCGSGVLQFPDVDFPGDASTRRRVDLMVVGPSPPDRPETCQRPASCGQGAGAVREVACLHHPGTLRAAVVGGFPGGGLRYKAIPTWW